MWRGSTVYGFILGTLRRIRLDACCLAMTNSRRLLVARALRLRSYLRRWKQQRKPASPSPSASRISDVQLEWDNHAPKNEARRWRELYADVCEFPIRNATRIMGWMHVRTFDDGTIETELFTEQPPRGRVGEM